MAASGYRIQTIGIFYGTGFVFAILLALNPAGSNAQRFSLHPENLEIGKANVSSVTYLGKKATRVWSKIIGDDETVVVRNTKFLNGTIEVELAGAVLPGADPEARGFIGIAFRVNAADPQQFESFFVRPTNGRAEDQLRRNHCTQYVSIPEHPWNRLRRENPGVYESYVDLQAAEWTRLKVVVKDRYARLYLNGSDQPCLIVKDMKHDPIEGGVALWTGDGTDGYFRNLKITAPKK